MLVYSVILAAMVMIPFIATSQKVIDFPPKIVVICKDGDTRKPMGGVTIVFRKGDTLVKTCKTDGCGRCLILKPKPGDYYIAATKDNYLKFTLSSVSVPGDQTVVLEIPLESTVPDSDKQAKKSGHMVASLAGVGQGDY